MPQPSQTAAINTSRRLYLLYHELRPQPTTYSYVVQTSLFAQHLDLYARHRGPELLTPEITFDDGHVSDVTEALPLLAERGLRAHFFITTGWTGERAGYMNWPQLRELQAAGQTIGAHGWSHTLLTHCSRQQLNHELRDARMALEDGLGVPVTTMSLPGGRSNRQVLQSAREAGYEHIFTSRPQSEPGEPGFTIGRFNLRGDMTAEWIGQLLTPRSGVLARLERQARIKDAAKTMLGDSLYARLWALLNRHPSESAEMAE